MTTDTSPPSPSNQAAAQGDLHLLGGADAGDLDILLQGGVYALVPQSPPARFPLCAGFLNAAVRSGRVCHVLLRTNPSDYLDRLEHSGWPQARGAWHAGSLRLYSMADGFPKLLFRQDVEGLTNELTHWGVTSGDILLVDAGDELLSLHDVFMATGQLMKIRTWAKSQKVSMLLNFALAGAGSSMASLTGLMDHFSGMARLHGDGEGLVVTLSYWQSEWGTVAERTVLLITEAGVLRVRPAPPALHENDAANTTSLGESQTHPEVNRRKARAEESASVPVTRGFFTNDSLWARELRMLTGSAWQSFASIADIRLAAREVAVTQIVLSFSQDTRLPDLARNIHFLRAELHAQTHIVIAEHRMALRYANELMLMKMGADAIIRQDIPLERWPDILQSLKSQTPRSFETLDMDAALAGASSSKERGVLELPHFVAEIQSTVEKSKVLDIPFAMAVLRTKDTTAPSALLKVVNVRRTGDLLTTDGIDVFVFFYACSLTMAPKVLAGAFNGELSKYVNEIDWMTSEDDIQSLLADLHDKQTNYKVCDQPHEATECDHDTGFTDAPTAVSSEHPPVAAHHDESVTTGPSTIPHAAVDPEPPSAKMDSHAHHDAAVQINPSVPDNNALHAPNSEVQPTPAAPSRLEPIEAVSLPENLPKDGGLVAHDDQAVAASEPKLAEETPRITPTAEQVAQVAASAKEVAAGLNKERPQHPTKDLPNRVSADRRSMSTPGAEDNKLLNEQHAAELIRRLVLPPKAQAQAKKSTNDQRATALIRRLASVKIDAHSRANNSARDDS